jgi:pyruvate dehydrogenase E1 component alpha subunit
MTTQINTDTRLESMLEAMMLIRAFEESNAALQAEGKAGGTCTAVGQEAAAVGVVRALSTDDVILTNHRSAGHLLARGADPARMLAEILGRRDGYCGGKSGTLHISVKELGILLTSTIVGGELTLAPGVALSRTMLSQPGIVVCFFGDGAACEGAFHESLNLSAVWNLPILYVCENNQWQAYVHRRETMLIDRISERASAYGIEGRTVDGNDVNAIAAATSEIAANMRRTSKPFLLETQTYRMRGHFEPDDQQYVDRSELAAWAERDPIQRATQQLLEGGTMRPADIDAMRARVNAAIEQARAFAGASPFPDAAELTTNVYA